jgi:hypothetical protein
MSEWISVLYSTNDKPFTFVRYYTTGGDISSLNIQSATIYKTRSKVRYMLMYIIKNGPAHSAEYLHNGYRMKMMNFDIEHLQHFNEWSCMIIKYNNCCYRNIPHEKLISIDVHDRVCKTIYKWLAPCLQLDFKLSSVV